MKVKGAVGESDSLPELSHPFKLASKYIVYSYISHSYMMDVLSYVRGLFLLRSKNSVKEKVAVGSNNLASTFYVEK